MLDEEEKAQAIHNVFALDDESLARTIQFIDSTVSKKKGFITYETETFSEHVMKAVVMGAKFPTLSKCEMYKTVEKLLRAKKSELNKMKSLSIYEEYMVPVVYKEDCILEEKDILEMCATANED